MQDVAVAIENERWDAALTGARARWKTARSPQLARLIELLGARGRAALTEGDHDWTYDPARVTPLLERAASDLRASDHPWSAIREAWPANPLVAAIDAEPSLPQHRNWLERVLAMLGWPVDDPRPARVLADWLTTSEPLVRSLAFDAIYTALADRLVALGDARVIPQLEAFLADADAGYRGQRALVDRVRTALARLRGDDPGLAPMIARLEAGEAALAASWAAVAARPADLAARADLGAALVAAGEVRGELFALQLAIEREPAEGKQDPRAKRVSRLLEMMWEPWLGSALASLLVRDGTKFRRGMLEEIRLGAPSTPRRAWQLARGHRELAVVHTVRTGRVPPAEYAQFVAALPHLTTLEVDHPETLHELARIGTALPIATLIYRRRAKLPGAVPPSSESFRGLSAPAITRVILDPMPIRADLAALVPALAVAFPALTSTILLAPSRAAARELEAQFAGVPGVTVELTR